MYKTENHSWCQYNKVPKIDLEPKFLKKNDYNKNFIWFDIN